MPNLFGAILVASDPEAHGYERPDPRPFEFDRVRVHGAFSFDLVAQAAGTSRAEIERLNPEYLLGVTPAERTVDLRLPVGRGPSFRDFFDAAAGARAGR